jgi:hypothetical protein
MIPGWKLKRELSRIGAQILYFPSFVATLPRRWNEPRRRQEHDAAFPENLRIVEGAVVPAEKVAIFIVFQPNKIAQSTFHTCRWLIENGYAPLIVSNCALSDQDRAELARHAWRVVERPNFGYDFGAYRDGIRLVQRSGLAPQRVILMNDSVWCPLDDSLMGRMEAIDADLTGLLQDEKVAHDRKGGTPTDQRHIESYFLMISGRLWQDDAFRAFWDDYPQTDYKPHTIKRGEIGFSRRMQAQGFSVEALTKRSYFMAGLAEASAAELRQILEYGAYDDKKFKREGEALLRSFDETEAWRLRTLNHIERWANRRRFNACFPLANARVFGTLFLKKSREPIFVETRTALLRMIEDGLVAPPPAVEYAEIAASVGRQPIAPSRPQNVPT